MSPANTPVEPAQAVGSASMLGGIGQDLRFALRMMRLKPGFTLVALLSLALGIGANTAIFQLIDAVRLRALPVKDPQGLVEVKIKDRDWASGNFTARHSELSYALWQQVRDHQQAFSGLFAFSDEMFNTARGGQAHYAKGLWVSGDAFNVLGVPPLLGRVFTPADDQPGCGSPNVVLSYSFWQREYGGQASAIGRTLTLDGHSFGIVGITPANFFGVEVGDHYDVAVPICAVDLLRHEGKRLERGWVWWLDILARLKPGWTVKQASAHLQAISPGIVAATTPTDFYDAEAVKHYQAYRLAAFPAPAGVSSLREQYQDPLCLLISITGLVLLIACANLANLLLGRASAREREIAVRLALGASRRRLIRQLLTESLLLAVSGALAGILAAMLLSRYLVSFIATQDSPIFVNLSLDWRVIAFTTALACLTCLLFGLLPAFRATQLAPGAAMKAGSRGLTMSRERHGLRRMLVVSQIALSLVLLVGALLFVRSLRYLVTLDPGFQQNGILIVNVDFGPLKLPSDRRTPFAQDLLARLNAVPGVISAASTNIVPIGGNGWNQFVLIAKKPRNESWLSRVSPGYFRTLGTPLMAGRDFSAGDTLNSPRVAIVNQLFARNLLGETNPVGKVFQLHEPPGKPRPFYEIVGLVKDTKYNDLGEKPRAIAFLPEAQDAEPGDGMNVLVRSTAGLAGLIASVKRTVAEVNPEIGLDFHVFETQIRDSLLQQRLMATLAGFFGFLAALLATIGLYGVISYMVARRTNEIGIRIALGADRLGVLRLVMREAALLLLIGVVVGAGLALAAARTASSMLFGLKPSDPASFALAMTLLGCVAALASYVPALRAARLDPMSALRDE